MTRRAIISVAALASLVIGVLGCGRTNHGVSTSTAPGKPGPLLVLVAASTKDAVQELNNRFSRANGIEVKVNADDSSKLAEQIVQGAPADLFLSANEKWTDYVKDKGFAQEIQPLLGNALVLIVPASNPANVAGPDDLNRPAVKKIAVAGPTVPAGIYARQALRRMKLWDRLDQDRKVVASENVRVALAYVERAEVEAGIVYSTDAKITAKVKPVYTFPPSSHDKIIYPLVLLKSGAQNEAARMYFDFLRSDEASKVFRQLGFVPLGP